MPVAFSAKVSQLVARRRNEKQDPKARSCRILCRPFGMQSREKNGRRLYFSYDGYYRGRKRKREERERKMGIVMRNSIASFDVGVVRNVGALLPFSRVLPYRCLSGGNFTSDWSLRCNCFVHGHPHSRSKVIGWHATASQSRSTADWTYVPKEGK